MKRRKHYAKPIILLALYIIYFLVLLRITIFRDVTGSRNVNVIPFQTINQYMRSIRNGIHVIGAANLLGNLIMFFPLGYMSASLFPRLRKLTRILLLSFFFSMSIELLQYILACGASDIDDVILNIMGGVTGYWIYALMKRMLHSEKFVISISALMIVLTYIGFFALDNFRFLVDFQTNHILK